MDTVNNRVVRLESRLAGLAKQAKGIGLARAATTPSSPFSWPILM